jgi:SM-20-related protein
MKETQLEDDILILDDVISLDIQKQLAATVKNELWGYNWHTAQTDLYPVWGRSVVSPRRAAQNAEVHLLQDKHQVASAAIWSLFTQSFLRGHSLLRAFVIGFNHGTEGYMHADNTDPEDSGQVSSGLTLDNYRSTILFAFDEWQAEWGGEMVIYNRSATDILRVIEPKPFRIISFPGLLPHKPNGPTRETDRFLPLLSYRSKQILRM